MTKSRPKGTIIEKQLGIPADYQYKAIRSGNFFQSNWHANKLVSLERLVWPGARILDLGTGSGNFEFRFAESASEIVGLDYYDEALAFVNKTLREMKIRNVKLKLGDVRDLQRSRISGKFNLIVMIDVIEHIEIGDAKKMIGYMKKLLKPGGKVCIVTPNYASSWTLLEWLLDKFKVVPLLHDEQHLAKYNPKNLKDLFTDAGFKKSYVLSFNLISYLFPIRSISEQLCRLELSSGIGYGNLLWGLFELK